jgi:GTP-binding protein
MLITSLDFSAFTGRIAIGRLERGVLKEGMPISLVKRDGTITKSRIKELHTLKVLVVKKVQEVTAGDICAIVGGKGLKLVILLLIMKTRSFKINCNDEPTMSMLFTLMILLSGKEGKFVTHVILETD